MNEHENKAVPAVLIVEDDQIIATLLAHLLKRRGFVTHLASDGQQAVTFLDTLSPPALVLLDIMLPFLDGFELIQRIRGSAGWENTPIIMLTSKTQERNVVRALDAGANDYVVKPFQPEELMARVRRCLKGSQFLQGAML